MSEPEKIIDLIYEAAVFPDLWNPVLDSLRKLASGAGTVLAIRRSDGWGDWIASDEISGVMSEFFQSDMPGRTEITARLIGADHPGFISEKDVFVGDEAQYDPFFRELMNPRGFGSALATAIQVPTGDLVIFHVQRRLAQGAFDKPTANRLNSLRPHLARASLLSTRLKLDRYRAATEALSAVGLPAAILSPTGQVLAANDLIQNMTTLVKWLAGNHLGLKDKVGQALYRQALRELTEKSNGAVRSFPLANLTLGTKAVGHVIPTPRRASDIFDGAACLFIVTPVTHPNTPDVQLIQALFDLTPAEARIAKGISQGFTINELAARYAVSKETVRSQLKGVLTKTGTHRQADLVAQIGGIVKLEIGKCDDKVRMSGGHATPALGAAVARSRAR